MEINREDPMDNRIDLIEIISLLFSRIGVILLAGVIGMALAIAGTKIFITPLYQSTTKMYILTKQSGTAVTSQDLQLSAVITKDYEELIKSRTVLDKVIEELGVEMSYGQLLGKLTISNTSDTRIITIGISDPDPYMASQIADAVRDVSAEHIQKVMEVEAVNVVDKADIPTAPASPDIRRNAMVGGAAGGALAVGVILLLYMLNDTVCTAEDVERYLQMSTLGSIPMVEDEKKSRKRVKRSKK